MGDAPVVDVVRARRYELVDDDGRLRAVIGRLDRATEQAYPTYGLALVGDDGATYRAEFAMDPSGVSLSIELDGNELVALGVSDPGADANRVGAHLRLSDLDGTGVLHWEVLEDGRVVSVLGGCSR